MNKHSIHGELRRIKSEEAEEPHHIKRSIFRRRTVNSVLENISGNNLEVI